MLTITNYLKSGVLPASFRTDSGCIDPDGSGPLQKGDGQFNRPGDIALDPLSNVVYVVDNLNGRIQKFDSNGKFITKWGSMARITVSLEFQEKFQLIPQIG